MLLQFARIGAANRINLQDRVRSTARGHSKIIVLPIGILHRVSLTHNIFEEMIHNISAEEEQIKLKT